MAKSKVSKNEQKSSAEKETSQALQSNSDSGIHNLQADLPVVSRPATATASSAGRGPEANGNGHATITMAANATVSNGHITPELAEKIKELVRLYQEQGYLTYNDINESLPENFST